MVEKHHSYVKLAKEHPTWYLWGRGKCKSWEKNKKRFNKCLEKDPFFALIYCGELLTAESKEKCKEAL